MPNKGISPIDPTSEVGALRLLVSDTDSIPLDPPQDSLADYNTWSDDALGTALNAMGGNQLRAAGTLYLQLAAEHSLVGRSIRTDDLTLDIKSRGTDLRLVAQSFFDQATAADNASREDFFQIVPFAGRNRGCRCVRPEGTPRPICRC